MTFTPSAPNLSPGHRKAGRMATLAVATALLVGCASTSQQQTYAPHPQDPLQSYNRAMYRFNDGLDRAVLQPVATTYTEVVPTPVRTGVSNFFGNLGDAWSFVNNTLQLKGEPAMSSFFRFAVNSTFGLGGLLDVATEMRLERHKQDFGLTLHHWGVPSGPYLVLPLLGPSTLRDTAAMPVDGYGNLASHLSPSSHSYALYSLKAIDTRAGLLQASDLLGTAALDPYSMMRDVYLSSRNPGQQGDGTLNDDYYYEEEESTPPAADGKTPVTP